MSEWGFSWWRFLRKIVEEESIRKGIWRSWGKHLDKLYAPSGDFWGVFLSPGLKEIAASHKSQWCPQQIVIWCRAQDPQGGSSWPVAFPWKHEFPPVCVFVWRRMKEVKQVTWWAMGVLAWHSQQRSSGMSTQSAAVGGSQNLSLLEMVCYRFT